jgi:HAD superfamily hydrolase (TIGR01509 family)
MPRGELRTAKHPERRPLCRQGRHPISDTDSVTPRGAFKAILWDNDGVLVETEHLYFEATRHVMASAGIALTQEQYVEFFLVQGRGAWHLAEERGIDADDIERLRDERNALYSDLLASGPRLTADVEHVLDALRGRYVMGVVTSSRKDHFDVIHRSTGLLKYFDFVLAAGDYGQSKPDPEPYVRAVERSGVGREACVAIEDSERGLASAKGAGISCFVIPSALTRGREFAGADRILGSVVEILSVL